MKAVLADPAEMMHRGAPHLIHSDDELEVYTAALFALTAKRSPTAEEQEAIDLLTMLIEHYEALRWPVPAADPATVLRFLMDRHGLAQKDLVAQLGSETTVSLVLSGRRQLTREHMVKLAKRFGVPPGIFLQAEDAA